MIILILEFQTENGRKNQYGFTLLEEGFWARGVSQDFYKISTQNSSLIEKMF